MKKSLRVLFYALLFLLPASAWAQTLTTSVSAINSVLNTPLNTASTAATFTVSGSGLTANVTVTAPTNFEVSTTSATTGFGGTASITASGTLTAKSVWVRLASNSTAGVYTGNVVMSSTGATSVNVATGNSYVDPVAVAPTNKVYISQVYGGGGNSGAPYNSDFVELYNPNNVDVDLTGWTVQYQSATGTSAFTGQTYIPAGSTIKAHGYFLIQEQGGVTGAALPTPDLATTGTSATSNNFNMAGTSGKVALSNNTAILTGAPPSVQTTISDFVAYGSVNYTSAFNLQTTSTTGAAPTQTNTTSDVRLANSLSTATTLAPGGTDATAGSGVNTNVNSADFVAETYTAGPPIVANILPRNSSSPTLFLATSPVSNPQALAFGTVAVGSSATKTFTIAGANLGSVATITVAAPFAVSSDGTTFGTSITVTQGAVATTPQTITVKYTPIDGSAASTSVAVSATGVTSESVALTGTGDVAPTNTTGYPKTANVASTSVDLLSNLNETGTTYYVLSLAATAAPSIAQIQAGLDGTGTAALKSGNIAVTAATTDATASISGLTAGTAYKIYVVSKSTAGTVQSALTTLSITTATGATAPAATTAAATSVTAAGATLNGSVSADGASTTVSFDYGTDPTFTTGNTNVAGSATPLAANATGTAETAAITGLTAGQFYYFRINGTNTVNTTNGSTLAFQTLPAATTLNSATAVTTTGFTVNWNAVTSAASYEIDVASDNGFATIVHTYTYTVNGSNPLQQAVTGLNPSTTYFYRVSAENGAGFGAAGSSSQATATPPPAITTTGTLSSLTTTAGNASSATTFTASGSNLTADITVSAPADFEVSKDNVTFASSITLTQTSGAVSSATVYVRLAAADAAGTYSGNITLNSTGATQQTVATASSTVNTPGAPAPSTNHVVISEVYGGGGNANAIYSNDYVELYNPTGATVDLSTYSIQYSSAAGTAAWLTVNLTGSIQSHGFYLIQLAAGATPTTSLPAADVSSTIINLSATAGKVALVNTQTPLTGANPANPRGPSVVDLFGYGTTATGFEGTPLTVTTTLGANTFSFERKANLNSTATTLAAGGADEHSGNGFDDDNNSNDFVIQGSLNPQNTSSPTETPAGSAPVSPASLTATPTTLAFNNVNVSAPSAAQTFSLSGANLTGTTTVSTTAPYAVSKDGITYATSITFTAADLATAKTISVQFTPTTTGAANGSVSITGDATASVSLTGTGVTSGGGTTSGNGILNATPVALSINNVAVGGTPGTQTFNLSGSNLKNTTTLTTAAPFAISKDGTTYATSISYTTAELATAKTVTVQFTPTASGPVVGTVSIVGDSTISVNVLGTTPVANTGGGTAAHVVLSEIYGGGGNANAVYTNDYAELYNPTGAAIDLSNYSFQYSSAAGTAAWLSTNLTGSIPSHGFYLIQLAAGTSVTNKPLPVTPDATTTLINLSASSGKLALVSSQTPLTGGTPTDPSIVDLLGYGAGTAFETADLVVPTNVTANTFSFERKANANSTATTLAPGGADVTAGNAYDTDNNSTDFVIQTALNPQSSASTPETPPSNTAPTAPTLAATPGSLDFGTTQAVNTKSPAKGFALIGGNLSADVTLTTAAPFSISSDGVTFSTTLTYTAAQMANPQLVLVRFAPTSITAATGSISITSTGLTTQTVALTGTGAAPAGTGGTTAVTITLNPIVVPYGNADFSPASSNNTNSANPIAYSSDNTAVATIVAGKIHIVSAGTANITASQPADGLFAKATNVTTTLTVTRALLTAKPDNQSRLLGAANPAFTVTYTGFVNNETTAVITTPPTVTTTAGPTTTPGTYPITASGAVAANYNFLYQPGTLTVTAPANYAGLTSLSLSAGTLSPAFAPGTLSYSSLINNANETISITATTGDPLAKVTINGAVTGTSGVTAQLTLLVGNNNIIITVTSSDGSTTQTYTINAIRGASIVTSSATNVLSPNGDGVNDAWVIKDIAAYPNNKVTVYDRAGRVVYVKTNYGNDWTGTVNGSPLAEDTYFYTIELGQNIPAVKGFITIVRTRK